MTIERPLGVVLAGGLARRMGGGDKARIRIGGTTILERVLARLSPQCSRVILNANGDPARFADTGLPVVADSVPDFAGPLAGILAGLDWAAAQTPEIADVVSVPGDCPFLPHDLVTRLIAARESAGTPLACAALNMATDRIIYKPLRSSPKLTILVSAIGVSFIFINLGLFWRGATPVKFPDLISDTNLLPGSGLTFTWKDAMVICVTVPTMVALTFFVNYYTYLASFKSVVDRLN